MICLKGAGFVDIYKLPGLEVLYRSKGYLSSALNAGQSRITEDGRLVINVNARELRQLSLDKDYRGFNTFCSRVQLFDPSKKAPEYASGLGPWYALPFAKSRPEYILRLFDKDRPQDLAPIDRTTSNSLTSKLPTYAISTYRATGSELNRPSASNAKLTQPQSTPASDPSTSSAGPSKVTKILGLNLAKLREREEKLADVGDRTQAAADTAQDFLHQVRAFNQAQAKKKWYQF